MVVELARLSHLQRTLRVSSEKLMEEVERNPDNDNALQCLRFVASCQRLEREINLLTKALLATQVPEGTS